MPSSSSSFFMVKVIDATEMRGGTYSTSAILRRVVGIQTVVVEMTSEGEEDSS